MRRTASVLATLSLLAVTAAATFGAITADSFPKPTSYVNDFAHVIDDAEKARLETFCTSAQQQLGIQFALVTIRSLEDRPIEDFAVELARKWGVGDKSTNSGILVLLSIDDRKSDIELGRGVEPYVSDGTSGSTLRALRPILRAGNYGQALAEAANSIAAQVAQNKGVAFHPGVELRREPPPPRRYRTGLPAPLILLGLFVLFWLLSRGGRGRGGRYYGGGGSGFWPGFVVGNMLGGSGQSSGWGGGGFGSDSGGSGGFGGFGGGDFGGGGASSDW